MSIDQDDRTLFEFLVLEDAQAGLSWETILKKRDRYREVFDHFDPQIVAGYDDDKVAALLSDSGIIRNRLKIVAAGSGAFVNGVTEFVGTLYRKRFTQWYMKQSPAAIVAVMTACVTGWPQMASRHSVVAYADDKVVRTLGSVPMMLRAKMRFRVPIKNAAVSVDSNARLASRVIRLRAGLKKGG